MDDTNFVATFVSSCLSRTYASFKIKTDDPDQTPRMIKADTDWERESVSLFARRQLKRLRERTCRHPSLRHNVNFGLGPSFELWIAPEMDIWTVKDQVLVSLNVLSLRLL